MITTSKFEEDFTTLTHTMDVPMIQLETQYNGDHDGTNTIAWRIGQYTTIIVTEDAASHELRTIVTANRTHTITYRLAEETIEQQVVECLANITLTEILRKQ